MSHTASPASAPDHRDSTDRKSVFKLIGDLPGLITTLVKDEIEQFKKELTAKAKAAGIGIGFFAGAAFFAITAWAVLVTTAILGLKYLVPDWLAALIIGVLLLIVAGVLAFIGLKQVKKGVPPVPEESVESLKDDVKAFKGVGNYDH